MKVSVISANLGPGGYDKPNEWPELIAPPGVTVDVHRLTDANFPPRPLAMTSRLQCGIPKWCGRAFVSKDTEVVIWIDASCVPMPTVVEWFLARLGSADIAVFAHPDRQTIREEFEFITAKLAAGNRYLTSRYQGEWLDEQFHEIEGDQLASAPLFASTAFAYRLSWRVEFWLQQVFFAKARHHLHDQLALAATLAKAQVPSTMAPVLDVRVIRENYLKCEALQYVRNKK